MRSAAGPFVAVVALGLWAGLGDFAFVAMRQASVFRSSRMGIVERIVERLQSVLRAACSCGLTSEGKRGIHRGRQGPPPKEWRNMIGQYWKTTIAAWIVVAALATVCSPPSIAEEDDPKDGALETALSSVLVVKAEERTGAAFLCISNEWVLTSLHVVLGMTEISVRVDEEEEIRVDGYCLADETQDLVFLHLEKPLDRKPLKLRPELPAVGTVIFAIGNPHDLGNSVSKGIVSGIRRGNQLKKVAKDPMSQIILQDDEQWVQFDAPIQPGNSGGPIVDRSGEVVGVVSRGLVQQDINFASPVVKLAKLGPQSPELKPKPIAKMAEDCSRFWELVQHLVSTSVDTKFMWLHGTASIHECFLKLSEAGDRVKQINEEDERRREWVQRRFANDYVARSIESARCFDRWIVKHQTIFLTQLVASDKMLLTEGVLSKLYPMADAELVAAFKDCFIKTRAYRNAIWQQHALFWDYVNAEGDEQRDQIAAKCKNAWDVINEAENQLADAGKVCLEMRAELEKRHVISMETPSDEGPAPVDEAAHLAE